ncbi:MAG: hypothetical protein ACI9F9_001889 [Candidatus Paceibacteria bacterium]|jgi:hypothetical protein
MSPSYPPAGTDFTQVAAGTYHSLALRSDGSIESWGDDSERQIADTPPAAGFIQIAAAGWHSIALRADGSIVSWGQDGWWNAVSDTPGGTGFFQVTAGARHALALRRSNQGRANCFGDGSGANCPCSANGAIGAGCASSTGNGATLLGLGDGYLMDDDFRLQITETPNHSMCLVLRGASGLNGTLGQFAGDGLLCVGAQTARSQVQTTSAGGTTFTDFQGNAFGASSYGSGTTTRYQLWYRDAANTCTGLGFNFSNAWTLTWAQ